MMMALKILEKIKGALYGTKPNEKKESSTYVSTWGRDIPFRPFRTQADYDAYFTDRYAGSNSRSRDIIIYANMPASSGTLTAKFMSCEVRIEKISIFHSLAGALEGDLRIMSYYKFEETISQQPRQHGMSVKVIYPRWQQTGGSLCQPLPPLRYEIELQHYANTQNSKYAGDMGWYYLKLIWFDNAPAADISLADYINSITSQLDFFQLTSEMTEEEKDWWC